MNHEPSVNLHQAVMNAKRTPNRSMLFIGNLPGTHWHAVPITGRPEIALTPNSLRPQYTVTPLPGKTTLESGFYPEHTLFLLGDPSLPGSPSLMSFQLLIRVGVERTEDGRLRVVFRDDCNAHTVLTRSGNVTAPLTAADAAYLSGHVNRELLRHFATFSGHLKELFPENWQKMTDTLETWTA